MHVILTLGGDDGHARNSSIRRHGTPPHVFPTHQSSLTHHSYPFSLVSTGPCSSTFVVRTLFFQRRVWRAFPCDATRHGTARRDAFSVQTWLGERTSGQGTSHLPSQGKLQHQRLVAVLHPHLLDPPHCLVVFLPTSLWLETLETSSLFATTHWVCGHVLVGGNRGDGAGSNPVQPNHTLRPRA